MRRIPAGFAFLLLSIGSACTEPTITKGTTSSGGVHTESEPTSEPPPVQDNEPAQPEEEGEDTGHIEAPPCASGEPVLEIGTGEDVFEPIRDGDAIEVIHGTQDGHHILGSLRTQNTAHIAAVRFQIIANADGVAISDQTYRLMMLPDGTGEPCAWTTIGMYAYLGRIDPGNAPFLLHPVTFQMDFEDDYGRALSQSVELFPFVDAVERDPPVTEPGDPSAEG